MTHPDPRPAKHTVTAGGRTISSWRALPLDPYRFALAFIFMFALCCYLAMRLEKRHTWRAWIGVGLIFGLAALARPNGIHALLAVMLVVFAAAGAVTLVEVCWRTAQRTR